MLNCESADTSLSKCLMVSLSTRNSGDIGAGEGVTVSWGPASHTRNRM